MLLSLLVVESLKLDLLLAKEHLALALLPLLVVATPKRHPASWQRDWSWLRCVLSQSAGGPCTLSQQELQAFGNSETMTLYLQHSQNLFRGQTASESATHNLLSLSLSNEMTYNV